MIYEPASTSRRPTVFDTPRDRVIAGRRWQCVPVEWHSPSWREWRLILDVDRGLELRVIGHVGSTAWRWRILIDGRVAVRAHLFVAPAAAIDDVLREAWDRAAPLLAARMPLAPRVLGE